METPHWGVLGSLGGASLGSALHQRRNGTSDKLVGCWLCGYLGSRLYVGLTTEAVHRLTCMVMDSIGARG